MKNFILYICCFILLIIGCCSMSLEDYEAVEVLPPVDCEAIKNNVHLNAIGVVCRDTPPKKFRFIRKDNADH